jgi:DNA mismatch repair protein MutS2
VNEHALEVLEYPQVIDILAGFATSGLGQRRVRALTPLRDPAQAERRLSETTQLKMLLRPEQGLPIGGLHDLTFALDELAAGVDVLPIEQIMDVADTLRAARQVRGYLEDTEPTYPDVARMAAGIGAFDGLEQRIDATFNDNGGIKNSASGRLKTLRNEIQILRGRIRGKLSSLMRSPGVAPHLQDTGIREHDNRPTLAIRAAAMSRVKGAQRGRSDSGGTVFIEPEGVRQMGDELAAAIDKEMEEKVRILREVTAMIAAQETQLRATLSAMAHLDMTYAKVRMSRAFCMQPPRLNVDGVIRLREARHPLLLDLQRREGVEEVVPIDVRLGDDFHTLIITGPNTGGKTVALKTIGLLTLMAMTGMHVPADASSTLPVLHDVWADIGDEQSIEQSLSTFSSHLTHIGQILRGADTQSLVLLDELGGGTDPAEGAALAQAILEFLHERGARTAVTTHISQLKSLGYTLAGVENASIEFDVETLKPTHRVLIGQAGSSNALALARRLGLPAEVIDRADARRQGDASAQLLADLQAARAQTLADREQAQAARDESRRLREETHRALEDALAQEEQAQVSSGAAAYSTMRELRRQLDLLCRDEPSKRSLLLAMGELRKAIDQELARAPVVVPRALQVGDRVHVRSLGRDGVLNQIDTRASLAVVDFGASPVTVALDEVEAA